MDRGAWQATVHGSQESRHGLATKPPPVTTIFLKVYYIRRQSREEEEGKTFNILIWRRGDHDSDHKRKLLSTYWVVMHFGDISGGAVAKTPHSHCIGSIPGQGTR